MSEEDRQMIRKQVSFLEYSCDGDTWKLTLTNLCQSKPYIFKSGEELDTVTLDDKPVKVNE